MKYVIATLVLATIVAVVIIAPCLVIFNQITQIVENFPEAKEFIYQGLLMIVGIVVVLCLLLVVELNTLPYKR